MPNENDDFDAEALNAGLNADTEKKDSYAEAEEVDLEDPEEQQEEEETIDPEQEEEVEEEHSPAESQAKAKQQRMQKLANERREEAEKRIRAEARAELLQKQLEEAMQTKRQQQVQQEEEALDPLEKWQRNANAVIQATQAQVADMNDKSNFLQEISKKPQHMAYLDRVEKKLQEARKSGFFPSRKDVLIRLIGEDALEKSDQVPAVRREAAARVKAATGKPLGSKSNVASTKSESTEYDRLKGIQI